MSPTLVYRRKVPNAAQWDMSEYEVSTTVTGNLKAALEGMAEVVDAAIAARQRGDK